MDALAVTPGWCVRAISYVRLENWLNRGSFDASAAYEGEGSKESRRAEIAELVLEEVSVGARRRARAGGSTRAAV